MTVTEQVFLITLLQWSVAILSLYSPSPQFTFAAIKFRTQQAQQLFYRHLSLPFQKSAIIVTGFKPHDKFQQSLKSSSEIQTIITGGNDGLSHKKAEPVDLNTGTSQQIYLGRLQYPPYRATQFSGCRNSIRKARTSLLSIILIICHLLCLICSQKKKIQSLCQCTTRDSKFIGNLQFQESQMKRFCRVSKIQISDAPKAEAKVEPSFKLFSSQIKILEEAKILKESSPLQLKEAIQTNSSKFIQDSLQSHYINNQERMILKQTRLQYKQGAHLEVRVFQ